jgi:flagellar M-ring protein FliF
MDQLRRLYLSLTLRQRIVLAVAVAGVAFGLVYLQRWNHERGFQPIYSGLAAEDASSVVAKLREGGAEYRLSSDGGTVLVRSDKIADLRLLLASAGLPKSGRIGFELFDKTSFGATDFAEQVNYHRALEGELERSVMSLAEVERARVHITRPKESVFLESRQPAKASVLVKLRAGAKLAPANVQSIAHLVASAVEGLTPERVSVMDVRGNLLSRPHRTLSGGEPSDAMIEYRQSIERDLLTKIANTIEPLLGPDKFRAGVSVECDFTSGEQSEETFDPERSVMAASQRTEDLNGAAVQQAGIPGTPSNLPRPGSRPVGTSSGGVARRTENISYQSSRTVRHTKLPQGTVQRVSVSLLVDHTARFEGEGAKQKRIVEPLPPERLKVIRDLVAGAIGLKPDRGDQLIVETLPFESTSNWESSLTAPAPAAPVATIALPKWLTDALEKKNFAVLGAVAGGILLAVLIAGAAAFLWLRRRRRKIAATVAMKPAIAGATPDNSLQDKAEARLAEQQALREKQEQELLASLSKPLATTKKGQVLSKHLTEEAKKNPANLAQIVRTWVSESES